MPSPTRAEKSTIAQLFNLEQEERAREEETYSQIADLFLKPRAVTIGEKFEAAIDVGGAQFEADIERYSLMGNVLLGRDNAAEVNKKNIEIAERDAAELSENFGGFEEFIKQPTFKGFTEQVVTQIGKFVPNAIASAVSAVGGMGVGFLGKWGLTQSSKRYANKLITDAARREMGLGATDVVSAGLAREAYRKGRGVWMKRGAITGAFAQEQFIGTAQSLAEYQEAGLDITRSEALMANILGIPQAVVGTFGEIYFAKALFKAALKNTALASIQQAALRGKTLSRAQKDLLNLWQRAEKGAPLKAAERELLKKALGGERGVVATFLKDVAVSIVKSGTVEGTTEAIQEGLGVMQRFAIDPDYTGAEARLRMAEAAFGGFFAGGARGGIGGIGTSIISQARAALDNREQALLDLQGREEEAPIGQTKEQIDAETRAMMDPTTNRNALWVSSSSVKTTKPTRPYEAPVYTIERAREDYLAATKELNLAEQEFDRAIVESEYEIQERIAIMEEGSRRFDPQGFSEEEEAAIRKKMQRGLREKATSALKEAENKATAIAATSAIFKETGRNVIDEPTYARLYNINRELIDLQETPEFETPDQRTAREAEIIRLGKERDALVAQIKEGLGYARARAADKLDQLELDFYAEYEERIVPNFPKDWAAENNLLVREKPTGTLYTTDPDKADLIEQNQDIGTLGVLLNFSQVDNKNHDLVLEVLDKDGEAVKQETTNEAGLEAALIKVREDYPTVEERTKNIDAPYTWRVRDLPTVVRERASNMNVEELMAEGAEGTLEEEAPEPSEVGAVDLRTGGFISLEGLQTGEGFESPTDVVIYKRTGGPWKGLKPRKKNLAFEASLQKAYSRLLEALEDNPVEQQYWEENKTSLNTPIIAKFLALKKDNPALEYTIEYAGQTEDGFPLHTILQHGNDVSMKQVILAATRSSIESYKASKRTAEEQGKKFNESKWGVTRIVRSNVSYVEDTPGIRTKVNPLQLTSIITASIFNRHQIKVKHPDGTIGFDVFQAQQEGMPKAVGPVVIKNEGAWLERVQQGVASMLLWMNEAEIDLYHDGTLITDFNTILDEPIYWWNGRSYSINQLYQKNVTLEDTSIKKQISTLAYMIENAERTAGMVPGETAGPLGDIEVRPFKWRGAVNTEAYLTLIQGRMWIDKMDDKFKQEANLQNQLKQIEKPELVEEVLNRMYGYIDNREVFSGDLEEYVQYMDYILRGPLPEGHGLGKEKARTLAQYFENIEKDRPDIAMAKAGVSKADANLPYMLNIYKEAKKYFRFNPEALKALKTTFPQQLDYRGDRTISTVLQQLRDEEEVYAHLTDIAFEMNILTPEERGQMLEGQMRPEPRYPGGELEQMIDSIDLKPFGTITKTSWDGVYDKQHLNRLNLEEANAGIAEGKKLIPPMDLKSAPIAEGVSYSEKAGRYFDQFDVKRGKLVEKGQLKRRAEEGILEAVSRIATKDLGLKGKTKIILADERPNFVFTEDNFQDEQGNSVASPNIYLKNVIDKMKNPPTNEDGSPGTPEIARVVTFGDTNIIIVNPSSFKGARPETVALTSLLAVTHELGHPFFDQEYNNLLDGRRKNLLARLTKDFNLAKLELSKIQPGDHPYLGEQGFEEWYADQVGGAIMRRLRNESAKTGTESYFNRVVNKLLAFWKHLNAVIRARFGPTTESVAFQDYMAKVIERHKKANTNNQTIPMSHKIKVRKFIGETVAPVADKFISKKNRVWFDKKVKQIVNWHESNKQHFLGKEKAHWSMAYLLLPADNYLRRMGPVGELIADVFYNPSQATVEQRGHLNARIWYANRKLNKVWDMMEPEKPGNPTTAEIEAFREVLFEAEAEVPTAQLSEKDQEVRKYLDDFWTTVSHLGIKKRDIFYPRQFDIPALIDNKNGERAALVRLLEWANREDKNTQKKDFSFAAIVDAMVRNEETSDDTSVEAPDRAADISIGMAEERSRYFRRIPNEALRWGVNFETNEINPGREKETGLLLPPEIALRKYITDMTKRSDYDQRAVAYLTEDDLIQMGDDFGDVGDEVRGWKAMEVLLSRIEDPVKRQGARQAVRSMLGKVGMNMPRWQRNLNSGLLMLNIMTYLTMATVASFPDLAGTILRSKGTVPLKDFVKTWKGYFTDRETARKFARDVGVITFDSLDTMYVNAAELGFMTPFSKKVSNFYFKTIGLEAFTKFTRVFAAGMGEQFLLRLAEDPSADATRWLAELKITREDILHWNNNNRLFSDAQGGRVQNAIAQFVDESVVRPNAAERPVWASNPYFALVWQLKSFFYAYGKNILGGVLRESKNRFNDKGTFSQAAIPLLLGAVPMLVLSMIGLELREFVKYLYANVDPSFEGAPADKFRTDDMGWVEYFFEIVDRAGLLGAFTLLFPMFSAGNYGDEFWVSPLGPTAQRLEDILKGDFQLGDDYLPWVSAIN